MTSTLYYVTLNLNQDKSLLITPKIPEKPTIGNDASTPRIRLAPSIKDAISMKSNPKMYLQEHTRFRVYKCTVSELNKNLFWFPEYLYKNDLVKNAFATNETWCRQPITMSGKDYEVVSAQYAPIILFDVVSVNDVLRAFQKIEPTCPIGGHYIDVHDAEWLYDQLSTYLHDNDKDSEAHMLYENLCRDCGCEYWDITSLEMKEIEDVS